MFDRIMEHSKLLRETKEGLEDDGYTVRVEKAGQVQAEG